MPNLSKQDKQYARELSKYSDDFGLVIVSRYILLSGDGYSTANSWQWNDSWRAVDVDLPRSTWFPTTLDAVGTKHLLNLFVPASEVNGVTPATGQRLKLFTPGGVSIDIFYNIHFVKRLRGNRETFAYQLIVESIQ